MVRERRLSGARRTRTADLLGAMGLVQWQNERLAIDAQFPALISLAWFGN
jgi:hypothetical protein